MQTLTYTFNQLVGTEIKTDLWGDVYNKLTNARFISGVDNYEAQHIIADLKKTYTGAHSAQQIANAIIACSKKRQKKISPQLFLLFVITKLG